MSTCQIDEAKSAIDEYLKACQSLDFDCGVRERLCMGYRNNRKLFKINVFREDMILETGNGYKLHRPIAADNDGDSYSMYGWYQCQAFKLPLLNLQAFCKHMFGKLCTMSPHHTDTG